MKASELGMEGKLIAEVPSSTTSLRHQVRLNKQVWTCTCLGFRASKSRPAVCRHIKLVWESIEESSEEL